MHELGDFYDAKMEDGLGTSKKAHATELWNALPI